jgi:parallel beta-helix repeat protein
MVFVMLLLLCLLSMGQVNAAGECSVTNTLDSGSGSLRAAIECANNHPGPDVIRFHPSLTVLPTYNSVIGNEIADNNLDGIEIRLADNNTIQGNTIVRNGQSGVSIENGIENYIYSNLIGTNAGGVVGQGNDWYGVLLYNGSQLNRVEGNVITQNTWSGVAILSSNTTTNLIRNNYIGVTRDGQPLGNGYDGVLVFISPGNTIQQNVIAHNGTSGSRAGVRIEAATATRNAIWSNSIYSNTGAGIELLSGGNNNRAAPTISQVNCPYVTGGGAPANGRVQLFSDNADEGRLYEGEVMANSTGQWLYRGSFHGPHLTATATDSANNTSPFSAPVLGAFCGAVHLPIIRR